jgi:hypothetical protein
MKEIDWTKPLRFKNNKRKIIKVLATDIVSIMYPPIILLLEGGGIHRCDIYGIAKPLSNIKDNVENIPATKLVPLEPKDIPVGSAVFNKTWIEGSFALITIVGDRYITFNNLHYSFEGLMNTDFELIKNGKRFPFYKEVEVVEKEEQDAL